MNDNLPFRAHVLNLRKTGKAATPLYNFQSYIIKENQIPQEILSIKSELQNIPDTQIKE
jgi:hypothetical protein